MTKSRQNLWIQEKYYEIIFLKSSIIKIPNARIDPKMKIMQLQTLTKEHRRSRQNRIENHRENLARNQDKNTGFPINQLLTGCRPPAWA